MTQSRQIGILAEYLRDENKALVSSHGGSCALIGWLVSSMPTSLFQGEKMGGVGLAANYKSRGVFNESKFDLGG
ncbi:hypothetical protein ACU8KH_06148 [Lachancea thermotolerans]